MSPPIISPTANQVLRRKPAMPSSRHLSRCFGSARGCQRMRAGLVAEDASALVPEDQTRSHTPRRHRTAPTYLTARIGDRHNAGKVRKRLAKSSLSTPFFLSPSSRESGCRGMGRARWAIIRPRHSLGHTPNPLALCLFQWPTRLADGFGLKEITLPATGRIHPEKWVPRSPNGDSAPEPLRYYFVAIAGERTFDPRVGYLEEDWRALGSALLSYLPIHMAAGFQGGAPLAAERASLHDPPH
jgi:hypothetical protein